MTARVRTPSDAFIKRCIRAAREADMSIGSVEISTDGTVKIVPAEYRPRQRKFMAVEDALAELSSQGDQEGSPHEEGADV